MDIKTVRGRNELTPRREPYWCRIRKGCHLGFRKLTTESAGSWIARYTSPTDGRSFKTLGQLDTVRNAERFDTARVDAESWFDAIEQTGSPIQRTVADACSEYLQILIDRGAGRKATQDVERRIQKDVLTNETFAARSLSSLSKSDFDRWRHALQYKQHSNDGARIKKAAATINRDMTILRAAMNLAFENQWVVRNTWKAALKPITVRQDPTVERCRTEYLTLSERRALTDKVPSELSLFIKVLCLVPIRPGALAKLKVGDYDKRQLLLTIPSDKANPRSIHVSSALDKLLREAIRNKLPTAPIISASDGSHWNKDKWKSPFKRAVMDLHLPVETVMYTIRHSVITDLIASGVPILTVAQLAGTSIRMIEKHYGKLLKADSISALELLSV